MTDPHTPPDYRSTVFLPTTDFPMRGNLAVKEPQILDRWAQMDLNGRLRAQSEDRPTFILHDGPPYANGNIHIGHALNKILKDIVVRSRQMMGFNAPLVPGWDCHGLPIEWKIEEGYRAKGRDKDAVPRLDFRAECRAFAEHWRNVQSGEFQRLGVGADWAHPYTTMTRPAEAQIVREIHAFLLNGLLYKGVKPVLWSVVEKTALAEAEIEYQDHTSTTLWVKFPVVRSPLPELNGASVVIWTTTPWTIPANRAIAYGESEFLVTLLGGAGFAPGEWLRHGGYTVLEVGEVLDGALASVGDRFVVASVLIDDFCNAVHIKPNLEKSVRWIEPQKLKGTVCAHPFRGRAGCEGYFDYDVPLYSGDFVTTDTGTGFVHIAPGHGEDDFNLGKKYGVAFDETVGDDGRYLPNVKGFEGLAVYTPEGKVGPANGAVIKALAEAGALLAKQNIKHSYPHSWRSKAPVIFRTTPQWFIALDKSPNGQGPTLREIALKAIDETAWHPAATKNRIRGMLESRPDWCISRQRAWGVPIALFVRKSDGQPLRDPAVCARIVAAFEAEGSDAWFRHPPEVFLGNTHDANDFDQVMDIVDVWFESGATHTFCLAPEGGTSAWPTLRWPADLYLEGSDQHRGWFHSSLLESCGTRGRAPYKAVLTHGFTLDEQGRKMSKSLGNVVAPQDITTTLGADILRLWVAATDVTQDVRIGPEILKQTGDLYRRLRNTLRYLLGALEGFSDAERVAFSALQTAPEVELERWVLHRLSVLETTLRGHLEAYNINAYVQDVHAFCALDLSSFYFDVRKDSLYCDAPESLRRRAVRTVMDHVFEHLVRWLAPVLCFTAEEAWLTRHGDGAGVSVHLEAFPVTPPAWRDAALAERWESLRALRRVVTGAMEMARNGKKIGSSLEAHVTLYVTEELRALPESAALPELFICSGARVAPWTEALEGAFTLPDVPGCAVVITEAQGHKCARCWQVLESVGTAADHPTLCARCAGVVAGG